MPLFDLCQTALGLYEMTCCITVSAYLYVTCSVPAPTTLPRLTEYRFHNQLASICYPSGWGQYPASVPKDQNAAWAEALTTEVTVYFAPDWPCVLVCIYM